MSEVPVLPAIPCCPHCSAELAGVGCYHWISGALAILSVFCGECRKVLATQIVPVAALPGIEVPSIRPPV